MKFKLRGIVKNHGKKEVLKGASYEFEQGKIYAILGRNGAGKTTLFDCVCGNSELDNGEISFEAETGSEIVQYEDIGMVSATPYLPEFLTGYEFIKFYMDINKNKIKSTYTIDEYFDFVRLDGEDRHRLIKEYSFGMKNKIQILCALISKPKVILLDEPLTSFDIVVSHDIKALLMEMKKDHIILMSTHILQLAQDVCDEIVILSQGLLQQVSNTEMDKAAFEEHIMNILSVG